LVPKTNCLAPRDAARNGNVLALTLGLLLNGRALSGETTSVTSEIERRWNALRNDNDYPGLPQGAMFSRDASKRELFLDASQRMVEVNKRQPTAVTKDVAAWVHCEYSLGLGVVLLAALCPEAASLPFQMVTIPLLEGE
jgi:hypothetical protein